MHVEQQEKPVTRQQQATWNKYIREIEINGEKIKTMIDMGSAVCVIKKSVVNKQGMKTTAVNQKLYGFGGGQPVLYTEKVTIKVNIDGIEEKIEAIVVPDTTQDVDLLLGRTLTERENMEYVKLDETLLLGYKE